MRKLLAFLAGLLLCHAAYSAQLFGTVDAVTGSATMSDKAGGMYNVRRGQKIFEGYSINTAANGEMHIVTVDGGLIALRASTSFRVDEYKANGGTSDKIFMSLFKGAARSITGWIGKRNAAAYRITTPTATIGIRGTDHETIVIDKSDKTGKSNGDEPGTYDTVKEGGTVIKTPHGEAEVRPGKFVFAPKDRAVAPILLAGPPKFYVTRRLKIEGRVEPRKEYLQKHMDQMLGDRIKQVKDMPGEQVQDGDQQIGDEALKDPTKPGNLKEQGAPTPVLQAVYLSPGRTAAIINGREVKLGEKFGEAKLIKVQDSEVTLRNPDGTEETLKMNPAIEKTPAPPSHKK
ncbi:MAG: hypothetical protein D4R48_03850 [Nitrosomonadales bacterium]|nr:MAG: hypothetical protein D4R48_03850 [Nitrosomonadales bacterium]